MTAPVDRIAELPTAWRRQAETLRRYGGEPSAKALELAADELAAALTAADAPISLAQAAEESGLRADYIGRLVREEKLTQLGEPGAPLVRPSELPKKARLLRAALSGATDRAHLARSVATSLPEQSDG